MVTKVVHYRRFAPIDGAWAGENFQTLLAKCFKRTTPSGIPVADDYGSRTFIFPGDAQFQWFCHNIVQADTSIFGSLCLFSPDIWAAVIRRKGMGENEQTLEKALADLEIAERPPADGEDFLRGIAYWLVVKDHLFVVQHVALQTKAFEQYFSQLFAASALAGNGEKFSLISVFDKDVVGGDLGDITAVQIGGLASRPKLIEGTGDIVVKEEDTQTKLGERRVSRFDKALDILKTMFGEPDAEKIMESLPAEAELEVDVRFGYRSKKRSVSRAPLAQIAEAGRNLPDGEVRAIGRDGKQVGNDLRLSAPMPFKLVRDRSSLIELDNARQQMLRAFQRFVEDGKIEL